MVSTRKFLGLALLAIGAVFSTASVSTAYYYHTAKVSGLHCQEGDENGLPAQTLAHTSRGILNKSQKQTSTAYCPLDLAPGGSYTINTVLWSRAPVYNGEVRCRLVESDTLTAQKLAVYPTKTYVPGDSTGIVTWHDIEPTVSGSTFTLLCSLLPGTGIISTSVATDRL